MNGTHSSKTAMRQTRHWEKAKPCTPSIISIMRLLSTKIFLSFSRRVSSSSIAALKARSTAINDISTQEARQPPEYAPPMKGYDCWTISRPFMTTWLVSANVLIDWTRLEAARSPRASKPWRAADPSFGLALPRGSSFRSASRDKFRVSAA